MVSRFRVWIFVVAGLGFEFISFADVVVAPLFGNSFVLQRGQPIHGWGAAEPGAVRYAWSASPVANLINAADLRAAPFRSDAW